jgi:hypothetical protein
MFGVRSIPNTEQYPDACRPAVGRRKDLLAVSLENKTYPRYENTLHGPSAVAGLDAIRRTCPADD